MRGILAMVLLSGCGVAARHAVGPTLDADGHVGVMYTASIGPMWERVAVPLRTGIGAVADTYAVEIGVGVDWIVDHPVHGQLVQPTVDFPGIVEHWTPTTWGKRLGVRTSWWREGDADALGVGAAAALTYPLIRRRTAIGLEGGCDLLPVGNTEAPAWRCNLDVVLDLSNPDAFDRGPIY